MVPQPARAFALCAALCAFVAFRPAIENGFVWDDHRLIETNRELTDKDAWKAAFKTDFWHGVDTQAHQTGADHRLYRPLLKLVLIAEVAALGVGDAFGYHVVSIVLHAACVFLVFRWLRRRFDSASNANWAALCGALVFALHPTRAESVAWISGMSDLWATLLVLLALEAWDRKQAILTAIILLTALLFKESVLAVPIALAADAMWTADSQSSRRSAVLRSGAVFGAMALAFLGRLLIVPLGDAGALGNTGSRPLRFLATAGQFANMALWPFQPTTQRGYIPSTAVGGAPAYPSTAIVLGAVVLASLAVAAFVATRRPAWRPVLSDLSWFWLTALPMLNIVPLAGIQYTAERFLYLPGLGLAALAARGAVALGRQ